MVQISKLLIIISEDDHMIIPCHQYERLYDNGDKAVACRSYGRRSIYINKGEDKIR